MKKYLLLSLCFLCLGFFKPVSVSALQGSTALEIKILQGDSNELSHEKNKSPTIKDKVDKEKEINKGGGKEKNRKLLPKSGSVEKNTYSILGMLLILTSSTYIMRNKWRRKNEKS